MAAIIITGSAGRIFFRLTEMLKRRTANMEITVNTSSGKAKPSIEKSRYIFPVLRERKSRKSFAIKSIPFFAISFSKSAAITLAAKKPGAIYCPILFFPKNKEHAQTTVDPMAIIM